MKNKIWIILGILIIAILGYLYFSNTRGDLVTSPADNNSEGTIEGNVVTPLPPQAGLPANVEAKRQAIYQAALSRNYDTLASLAPYPNSAYSFGMPYEEGGFAGYMKLSEETEGESAFDIIPTLLRLPYSKSGAIYAWPGVFHKEPGRWTAEDIAVMKTFLTDEEIEGFRQFGGYIYWRLGIDENGEWVYYIAGD